MSRRTTATLFVLRLASTSLVLAGCVMASAQHGAATAGDAELERDLAGLVALDSRTGQLPAGLREATVALHRAQAALLISEPATTRVRPLPPTSAEIEQQLAAVTANLEQARAFYGHEGYPVPEGVNASMFGALSSQWKRLAHGARCLEPALEMTRALEQFQRARSIESANAARTQVVALKARLPEDDRSSLPYFRTYCARCDADLAMLDGAIEQLEQVKFASAAGGALPRLVVADRRVAIDVEVTNQLGAFEIATTGRVDLEVFAARPGDATATLQIVDCPAGSRGPLDCDPFELGDDPSLTVDRSQKAWVRGADGRVTVYAQPKGYEATYLESLFAGPPAASAPASARNLAGYGLSPLDAQGQGHSRWVQAADLFAKGPRGFVVYAREQVPTYGTTVPIAAGEPVVLVGKFVLRANGELVQLDLSSSQSAHFARKRIDPVDALFATQAPAKILLPPPVAADDPGTDTIYDDLDADFSVFVGLSDRRVTAHQQEARKVGACVNKVAGAINAKLGNGGYVGGWEVVTTRRDGTLVKRQSLSEYEQQKARAQCPVAKLEAKRSALRTTLRREALVRIQQAFPGSTLSSGQARSASRDL